MTDETTETTTTEPAEPAEKPKKPKKPPARVATLGVGQQLHGDRSWAALAAYIRVRPADDAGLEVLERAIATSAAAIGVVPRHPAVVFGEAEAVASAGIEYSDGEPRMSRDQFELALDVAAHVLRSAGYRVRRIGGR